MTDTAPTASAQAVPRGQPGETRSIGKSILLAIVTLGIYAIYWTYKTQDEIKRYSGNGVGGVLGLVIYLVISPVTYFVVPSEVRYMYEDLDGGTSPVRGKTARTVTTKLRYTDFSIRSRSTTMRVAIDYGETIAELACGLLDRALKDRPGALRLAGVGVSGLVAHHQLALL